MRDWSVRLQFAFAAQLYQWLLSSKGREMNLPAAYPRVLLTLDKTGVLNQRQLAHECLMQPSGLTRVLKDMESEGLVMREGKGWRGEIKISITEKGREIAEKVERMLLEVNACMLDGISKEEEDTFVRLLAKITDNMQRETVLIGRPFFTEMHPLRRELLKND